MKLVQIIVGAAGSADVCPGHELFWDDAFMLAALMERWTLLNPSTGLARLP